MKTDPDRNLPSNSRGNTQALGRFMLMGGFAAALALLTWFMQGQLDKLRNPNQDVESVIGSSGVEGVQLKRNRYGHYVATGRINGQPVVFLLDTGASHVSVPEPVANRLGLTRGPARRVNTANGSIETYATRLDSVELGSISLRNVRGGINPHMDGEEILLGMSFLKELDWFQRGNELTLLPRR